MTKFDALYLLRHRFVTDMCQELGTSTNTWYRYSDPLPKNIKQQIIGIAKERSLEIDEKFLK